MTMVDTIRLACRFCDRDDYDGVAEVPRAWFDVFEVQSYAESIRPVEVDDPDPSRSVLDWYTHLGVCPECYAEEIAPPILA
jgi:hypothetical protein